VCVCVCVCVCARARACACVCVKLCGLRDVNVANTCPFSQKLDVLAELVSYQITKINK
jgi:hypothetical protein